MPSTNASNSTDRERPAGPPRSGPSSRHTSRRTHPHNNTTTTTSSSSTAAASLKGRIRTVSKDGVAVAAGGNGAAGAAGVAGAGGGGGGRQPLRSMASMEVVARTESQQPQPPSASSKQIKPPKSTAAAEKGAEGKGEGGVKKKRSQGKLGKRTTAAGGGSGQAKKADAIRNVSGSTENRPVATAAPVAQVGSETTERSLAPTPTTKLNPSAPEFSFAPTVSAVPISPPTAPASMIARPIPIKKPGSSVPAKVGSRCVSDPVRSSSSSFATGSNRHPLPPKPTTTHAVLPSKPDFLPERPPDDGKFSSLTAAVPLASLRAQLPTSIPNVIMRYPVGMSLVGGIMPSTGVEDDTPDSPVAQVISSSLPPILSSIPTFVPLVPLAPFYPIATAPMAQTTTEDLTPRTQRRVAGQGLKKAMSEAALRRRLSASSIPIRSPPQTSRAALGVGIRPRSQQPRCVSDPNRNCVTPEGTGAHRRSVSSDSTLKKLPIVGPSAARAPLSNVGEEDEEEVEEFGEDEEDKENAPPSMPISVFQSPSTPSPRPSIVSLPGDLTLKPHVGLDDDALVFCADLEDEEEGVPASPPSPAAMLLSASFASWPAEACRPASPRSSTEGTVFVAEPLEMSTGRGEDVKAVEEETRSYVPKPLLLPSKLARATTTASSSASSTSTSNGLRSPKTSTSTTASRRNTGSHVRASTLAGVNLSFSALAETAAASSPTTGFQGRRESFVGITGSPVRRRFGPIAGAAVTTAASVRSRTSTSSVLSLSPPASPTLPLSPTFGERRRVRGSVHDDSLPTSPVVESHGRVPVGSAGSHSRPALHSRSISVGSGWRRERPASIGPGSGLGLGFMKAIEEAQALTAAVPEQKQEMVVGRESGNGKATVSSGSEAGQSISSYRKDLLGC